MDRVWAPLHLAGLAGPALLLVVLLTAAPPASLGEDRCADARRTCEAWCDEHRGPDGTCHADCRRRYQRCKKTGLFIWGQWLPDKPTGTCRPPLPDGITAQPSDFRA